MILDCDSIEDMVFHAYHVYAVKQAFDTGRTHGIATKVDQITGSRHLAGHRIAAIHQVLGSSVSIHLVWLLSINSSTWLIAW